MRKFGTLAKKIAKWYQEVESKHRKILAVIYGSTMLIGLITVIYALSVDIGHVVWIGLLTLILPPIILFTELLIRISSFFWKEFVKSFFLGMLWIRKQGFSVLLTREYGIQFGAILFACFALYQFRIFEILPALIMGALLILVIISAFSGGGGDFDPSELPAMILGVLHILVVLLIATIPGFFVGFLTGSEDNGKNSVGLGSFLAVWANFVYWIPEIFSWSWLGDWLILIIVLILIGMAIYSLIICGIGMFCGGFGAEIGVKVRRKILKKYDII